MNSAHVSNEYIIVGIAYFELSNSEPIWKVARYTSAAPLFFTESDHYVDGGVLANNPTEYALTAINNFYRYTVVPSSDKKLPLLISFTEELVAR